MFLTIEGVCLMLLSKLWDLWELNLDGVLMSSKEMSIVLFTWIEGIMTLDDL